LLWVLVAGAGGCGLRGVAAGGKGGSGRWWRCPTCFFLFFLKKSLPSVFWALGNVFAEYVTKKHSAN